MAKDRRVEKVRIKNVTPFGPMIMAGEIPRSIYKDFRKIVTKTLKEKKYDHKFRLAGRLEDEWTIPEIDLFQTQVDEFLTSVVERYATDVAERMLVGTQVFAGDEVFQQCQEGFKKLQISARRQAGWVNEMISGEYNPVHHHPYANVTSVFFFTDTDEEFIDEIIAPNNNKNEEGIEFLNTSTTDDGSLEIIYGSDNHWQVGTVRVKPKERMFLIFPANLLHTVYPFKSKSKRISASFNFQVDSNVGGLNFGDK
jgi:hypothetical protein